MKEEKLYPGLQIILRAWRDMLSILVLAFMVQYLSACYARELAAPDVLIDHAHRYTQAGGDLLVGQVVEQVHAKYLPAAWGQRVNGVQIGLYRLGRGIGFLGLEMLGAGELLGFVQRVNVFVLAVN